MRTSLDDVEGENGDVPQDAPTVETATAEVDLNEMLDKSLDQAEEARELPETGSEVSDSTEAVRTGGSLSEQLDQQALDQSTDSRDSTDLAPELYGLVNEQMRDAAPAARELYDDYKDSVRVLDDSYDGPAHYDPQAEGLRFNAEEDLENPTGPGSTYLHEVGHMLDHHAGADESWLSASEGYRDAINRDVEGAVQQCMEANSCSKREALEILSEELEGHDKACVSDIFGSVTHGECQGDYGHAPVYWDDPSNIEKEAFANMFESSVFEEKSQLMKEYLPTAYQEFLDILRRRAH